ncbi:MAG: C-type lectin domain-containing protein [Lachnospiraceae bacterium]|nr:C-type lectin domain-containing protein [Lachnospiraceae bacterium]
MKLCPECQNMIDDSQGMCMICGHIFRQAPAVQEPGQPQDADTQSAAQTPPPADTQPGQIPKSVPPVYTNQPSDAGKTVTVKVGGKSKKRVFTVIGVLAGLVLFGMVVRGITSRTDDTDDSEERRSRREERARDESAAATEDSSDKTAGGIDVSETIAETEDGRTPENQPSSDADAGEVGVDRTAAEGEAISEEPQHEERYELYGADMTWTEANEYAQQLGGHLATITSQDEMDYLSDFAQDSGLTYIWLGGLTYTQGGSVYGEWITGEYFGYSAWTKNEPSGVDLDGTAETYMMLWKYRDEWGWNDQRDDPISAAPYIAGKLGFFVEYDDAPYPWLGYAVD